MSFTSTHLPSRFAFVKVPFTEFQMGTNATPHPTRMRACGRSPQRAPTPAALVDWSAILRVSLLEKVTQVAVCQLQPSILASAEIG